MTPEGAFSELAKNELRDEVLVRAGILSPVLAEMTSGKETFRAFFVGEQTDEYIPSLNKLPIKRFGPVRLVIRTADSIGEAVETKVELHGQRPWVWKDRTGKWNSLVLTGSGKTPKKKATPDQYILEPLLFWMFCLASDDGSQRVREPNITFHVVYKEQVKTWTYSIGADAAREYLERVVSDYLNQERLEWLPFEAATSQSIQPHKLADDEIDEDKKAGFQLQLQAAYADDQSFLIKLVHPHVPYDAFDKVRNRFQVFFKVLGEE